MVEITEISFGMKLDRYKIHDIEILIDTVKVEEAQISRLKRSMLEALKHAREA